MSGTHHGRWKNCEPGKQNTAQNSCRHGSSPPPPFGLCRSCRIRLRLFVFHVHFAEISTGCLATGPGKSRRNRPLFAEGRKFFGHCISMPPASHYRSFRLCGTAAAAWVAFEQEFQSLPRSRAFPHEHRSSVIRCLPDSNRFRCKQFRSGCQSGFVSRKVRQRTANSDRQRRVFGAEPRQTVE